MILSPHCSQFSLQQRGCDRGVKALHHPPTFDQTLFSPCLTSCRPPPTHATAPNSVIMFLHSSSAPILHPSFGCFRGCFPSPLPPHSCKYRFKREREREKTVSGTISNEHKFSVNARTFVYCCFPFHFSIDVIHPPISSL